MPEKRKAVTRDAPQTAEAAVYDELGNGVLDGILSQSEDDQDDSAGEEVEEDDSEDDLSDDIGLVEDSSDDFASEPEEHSLTTRLQNSSMLQDSADARLRVTEDANGNERYVYRDIDPVYESDDSDAQDAKNTVGDIPLSFYDSYPHIGYDIHGKRIQRPAKGAALDSLLDSIEIPEGWTGLTDPATGKPLNLSSEELDVLKRLTRNEVASDDYDPYPPLVEYFSSITEPMPLSAAPEPKRRFVPSRHEAKRVMKLVRAIKEGRIKPYTPPTSTEDDLPEAQNYDLWASETPRIDHAMHLPAPKLPPPTHSASYHPPAEYLPTPSESATFESLDEEDRPTPFLPSDHTALRKVPGYARFVKDRFERGLDLYLAPRVRRTKLDIDPASLLPKLPSPEELRPFPNQCARVFRGHDGRVRTVAVDPTGLLLASGGDDGTVRLWSLTTGAQLWKIKLSSEDAVDVIRWRPGKDVRILAAAAGETVHLIAPPLAADADIQEMGAAAADLLKAGYAYTKPATQTTTKDPGATWHRPSQAQQDAGVLVSLTVRSMVKVISWHVKGDYFSTVSPKGQTRAVAIHTLSKHISAVPFRRLKGLAQSVQFHPSKPLFFVATQGAIRVYDLARAELVKTLQPGAKWISGFDVHPGGDNVIVSSYDRRLLWLDLDLSSKPYKTLRYHSKAIRAARFHKGGYPLFADASDDGSLQIFHGKVYDDLMENATIVPLKVLRGHVVTDGLGVLDLDWCPTTAACVSAGADGTCRLWAP